MSITVIDYGSGNLRSAAKALEIAAHNVKLDSKIIVTSDPKKVKESKKIILPGQGSFRDCYLGIKKIAGLEEALNESVLVHKRPIFGICVGMQLFAKIGYESQETKGFGWIDASVRKINNINNAARFFLLMDANKRVYKFYFTCMVPHYFSIFKLRSCIRLRCFIKNYTCY